MLSIQYHIAYWAAAACAVAIYRVLSHRHLSEALRLSIGPLTAYITYTSIRWQYHASKRTDIALYTHQGLVACLLVALGSITEYFQLPSDDVPTPTALIHLLSAFLVIGNVESLRQNRSELQPASFRLVQSGPRTQLYCRPWGDLPIHLVSILAYNAILFAVLIMTDEILKAGGMSLRHIVPYWGWQDMQYQGRLGSAIAAHYLGGPFADMAETVGYKFL
ncbi:hypothetical protein HJFPF1_11482 [Paramyrothecium foliicola]|nr:hypothetical protein HJFPF1_11482 [Paramyrothecium foliicola]